MHHIHTRRCPAYMADTVKLVSENSIRLGLHSASTYQYIKPKFRIVMGERAFCYAGPNAWNSLPPVFTPLTVRTCLSGDLRHVFSILRFYRRIILILYCAVGQFVCWRIIKCFDWLIDYPDEWPWHFLPRSPVKSVVMWSSSCVCVHVRVWVTDWAP